MRSIKDGKLYSTDEAEKIADWSNIADSGDFRYFRERLYRTEKGNWFLHGKGGARSKYKVPTSGGHTGGEKIRPLTRKEAFQWCQKRDCVDVALQHFDDLVDEA